MKDRLRECWRAIVAGVLALALLGVSAPSSFAAPVNTGCVNQPALQLFDPNGDGLLTLAELKRVAGLFPSNKDLQDAVQAIENDGLTGVRYDGECGDTEEGGPAAVQGQAGASVAGQPGKAVAGKPGQAVAGKPGESVVGKPGESVVVVGKPGESAAAVGKSGESVRGKDGESVVGQDGESVVGEPGTSSAGVNGNSVYIATLPSTGGESRNVPVDMMSALLLGTGGLLAAIGALTLTFRRYRRG